MPTYDLWEERSTFPELEDNHTYSLAVQGLKCADTMIEPKNKKWLRCAREMEEAINKGYDASYKYFCGLLVS